MGTMRILDCTGDTLVDWDIDDRTAVAEAEELFLPGCRRNGGSRSPARPERRPRRPSGSGPSTPGSRRSSGSVPSPAGSPCRASPCSNSWRPAARSCRSCGGTHDGEMVVVMGAGRPADVRALAWYLDGDGHPLRLHLRRQSPAWSGADAWSEGQGPCPPRVTAHPATARRVAAPPLLLGVDAGRLGCGSAGLPVGFRPRSVGNELLLCVVPAEPRRPTACPRRMSGSTSSSFARRSVVLLPDGQLALRRRWPLAPGAGPGQAPPASGGGGTGGPPQAPVSVVGDGSGRIARDDLAVRTRWGRRHRRIPRPAGSARQSRALPSLQDGWARPRPHRAGRRRRARLSTLITALCTPSPSPCHRRVTRPGSRPTGAPTAGRRRRRRRGQQLGVRPSSTTRPARGRRSGRGGRSSPAGGRRPVPSSPPSAATAPPARAPRTPSRAPRWPRRG